MQTRRRSTGPTSDVVDVVLERAQHSCEVCGIGLGDRRGVDYSIHHRLPRQMGGTRWAGCNLPSNLLLVCGSATTPGGCHATIESHRAGAVAAGWLVLSRTDPARVACLITRDRWVYLNDSGEYSDEPPEASG